MENEKLSGEITPPPTNTETSAEEAKITAPATEEIDIKQKLLGVAAHAGWLLTGFGYILFPIIIYLFANKKFPFAARHAKQALKAQALLVPLVLIVMFCSGDLMLLYGLLLFFYCFFIVFLSVAHFLIRLI